MQLTLANGMGVKVTIYPTWQSVPENLMRMSLHYSPLLGDWKDDFAEQEEL